MGDPYVSSIEEFRSDVRKRFLETEYSPLRTGKALSGLRYFDPDPSYRITCQFRPLERKGEGFAMTMNDGQEAPFFEVGEIRFTLNGFDCRLSVYKREGFDFFFIPYKDRSNGSLTYGGGRFVDFDPESVVDGEVEVDFNRSYNPWCHYDSEMPCPMPPEKNTLPVSMPVGEMRYGDSADAG
jgi:uncharacterized protein (DUF1684 family)